MRIGIIGSGNMGRFMGLALAAQGYEVFFGARRPEQAREAASYAGDSARHGTNDEAAAFADVLVWTVREVDAALILQNPSVLDGKVLIDLNNNENRPDNLSSGQGDSAAVRLQHANPHALVVKAFNTLPQEVFAVPKAELAERSVSVFLAGDDEKAKHVVHGLATDLGFTVIDLGPLSAAVIAETLADVVRAVLRRGVPLHSAISVQVLSKVDPGRFGGRQTSALK